MLRIYIYIYIALSVPALLLLHTHIYQVLTKCYFTGATSSLGRVAAWRVVPLGESLRLVAAERPHRPQTISS